MSKGGGFLDSILGIAYEDPTDDDSGALPDVESRRDDVDEPEGDEEAGASDAEDEERIADRAAAEANIAPPQPATDRGTRTGGAPRDPEPAQPTPRQQPPAAAPEQPTPAQPTTPTQEEAARPAPTTQPAPAQQPEPTGRPRCPHGFARQHDGRCKRCDDEGLPPFPGPDGTGTPTAEPAAPAASSPSARIAPSQPEPSRSSPSPATPSQPAVDPEAPADERRFTIDWSGERAALGDPGDVGVEWPAERGVEEQAETPAAEPDPSGLPIARQTAARRTKVGILGGLLGFVEEPLETPARAPQLGGADEQTDSPRGAGAVSLADTAADTGADTEADTEQRDDIEIIRPTEDDQDVASEAPTAAEPTAPSQGAAPAGQAPTAPQAAPEQPAASQHAAPEQAPVEPATQQPAAAAADHVATAGASSRDAELIEALTSFDVGRRRNALRALLDAPIDAELAAAAATSLGDPELGVRHLALEVLERVPQLAPADNVRDAIYDADPGIRARALQLLARTRDPGVIETIGERLLTESDDAVVAAGLGALASLLRIVAAGDTALDAACAAVGAFDPTNLPRFARELRALAAAIDEGDLLHRLGAQARRVRIGAAILAHASGSEQAERALARLVTDDEPLIRRLAASVGAPPDGAQPPAPSRPDPGPQETATPEIDPEAEPSRAVTDEVEQALLPGLIEALGDPKPEIREQAARALTTLPRERVVRWLADEADASDPDRLALLVNAAARLGLVEAAASLARTTIDVEPDRRSGRLTAALRSFDAVGEVAERWAADEDPRRRLSAVRLAAILDPADEAPVLQALEDPNAKVRVAAIEVARTPSEGLVGEALRVLLERDTSPTVRQTAIGAFSGARAADRLDVARVGISSPHAELRRAAVQLLRGDSIDEFNLLARALRDDDEETAEHAANVLTSHGGPETIAVLWSQLRGTSGATRQRVLEVLQRVAPHALGRLASQATSSSDPTERIAGLSALATLGVDRGLERLLGALDDPATEVRLEALRAISGHPYAVPVRPVCRAVRDPETEVRATAVETLGILEDDDALPDIVEALGDTEEIVWEAARRALVTRRSPKVVDLLLPDLARPARRGRIVDVLIAMDETATGPLLRALPRAEPAIRDGILEALRASGLAGRLIEDLRHPKTSRRRAALTVLAVLRQPETVPPVIERLGDPDPRIRQQAARLLGDLGDERAIEPLRRVFATDLDMEVVAVVEDAYRRLTAGARR